MSDANGADSDRTILILYATETGNAQDVADRIARQCRRIHVKARVLSMDAYPAVCVNDYFSYLALMFAD